MTKSRSLAELIPYLQLVTDSIVVTKESALLAVYEYSGQDIGGISILERDATAYQHDSIFRELEPGSITLWYTFNRTKATEYLESSFDNEVAGFIDANNKTAFLDGENYVNKHYLTVCFDPPKGTENLIRRYTNYGKEGLSSIQALIKTIKSFVRDEDNFRYTIEELEYQIKQFEEVLISITDRLTTLQLTRLQDAGLLEFLQRTCNPYPTPTSKLTMDSVAGDLLDSILPSSAIAVGGKVLHFCSDHDIYGAAISLKGFPQDNQTGASALSKLLTVSGNIVVSECYRTAPIEHTRKYIAQTRQQNQLTMYSVKKLALGVLKPDALHEGSANPQKLDAIEKTKQAEGMVNKGLVFGYFNLTVMVYAKTLEELDSVVSDVNQRIRQSGFVPVRESLGLLSAFAVTIPGQWKVNKRWSFIDHHTVSNLAPLWTVKSGLPTNKYLSNQTRKPCSALTILPTDYQTPFFFNFHVHDLSHTFIVGPSRSGKTVFVNFLISQFQKYHPVRTVIFDKDRSCWINTIMHDGNHIDFSKESSFKINPFSVIEDEDSHGFLIGWLEDLVEAQGEKLSIDDKNELQGRIYSLARNHSKSMWTLDSLLISVNSELKNKFQLWLPGGAYAHYLRHDDGTCDFNLERFTCIETGDFLVDKRVAGPLMNYFFYRISKELKRNPMPSLLYLEEVWFMMENPHFSSRLNNWLKTLARDMCTVILCTQSLEDFRGEVFASIQDNIATRIFLPFPMANSNEKRAMYKGSFGLLDEQINDIAQAVQKMEYMISQPNADRLWRKIRTKFNPDVVACLRSDIFAKTVFQKHYNHGKPLSSDWKADYITEVTNDFQKSA